MAEENGEFKDCVLKGKLTACLRDHCCYWDSELGCCLRGSLKLSQVEREAWRARKRAEVAALAGGEK